MKKQRFFMLGIITVLVAVLSLTFVSSTFAKYTTSNGGQDTARVAYWGINIAASTPDIFDAEYNGTDGVTVQATENVLAPGTSKALADVSLSGTAEVDVNITYTAEVTLTGWEVDGIYYCPLVVKVGSTTINGNDCTDMADFKNKIEDAVSSQSKKVEANQSLGESIKISWEWAFHVDAANDAKDTKLGQLAVAPTFSFDLTVTATQID